MVVGMPSFDREKEDLISDEEDDDEGEEIAGVEE